MIPLVSIIVPVYNVNLFIKKCISSLVKQNYQTIEIILIDDGSPDNCGIIMDEFSETDKRIFSIHTENRGVSAARNIGLQIASGDYIMFVDGDDYVDSDYVEYFLSLLINNSCKMAVGLKVYYKEGLLQVTEEEGVIDAQDVIENIYLQKLGVAVWNKIYSKRIIDEYSLRFNENFWFAEGMLFNITYLQYIEKVAIGNKMVYYMVENMNSATRKFNLDSWICGIRSMEYQRDHWIKVTQNIQMAWEFHYRRYAEEILKGLIKTESREKNIEIYDSCIRALKNNLRITLQVDISEDRKMHDLYLSINPENIIAGCDKLRKNTFTEKIQFYLLDKSYLIPQKYRAIFFDFLEKYCKAHYKPYYLDRSLI